MTKYTVVKTTNEWLYNYKGKTYTDKLRDEIFKGIISEHAKYKSGNENFTEQLGKKCLVTCLDPQTMELEALGASSLLRNESTGQIIDNLILDNFGLWFSKQFVPSFGNTVILKDTSGSNVTVATNHSSAGLPYNTNAAYQTLVHMGSGTSTPIRADFNIQTALLGANESVPVITNIGAWTASNTVIYQADVNPTSSTGTVNEAGTIGLWHTTAPSNVNIMLTRDHLTTGVPFTANKLLRASYIWSL